MTWFCPCVYVDRIKLTNIRSLRQLDFSFRREDGGHAGLVVLVGENGSGKTTALRSIATAFVGSSMSRTLSPSYRGWISAGASKASIRVDLKPSDDDFPPLPISPTEKLSLHFSLEATEGGEPEVASLGGIGRRLRAYSEVAPETSHWKNSPDAWFACGFGPYRRFEAARSSRQQALLPVRVERFQSLFDEIGPNVSFDAWLRELHYKSLDRDRDWEYERMLLSDVRELINDGLLPGPTKLAEVRPDGLVFKTSRSTRVNLNDLSEGYKNAIGIVIEIIRLMHIRDSRRQTAPKPLIVREDGHLVVNRSGVVLIDELDAHLHPEWQRKLGLWLVQRFPRIQFIVSTHSPFVVQAAGDAPVFHFPLKKREKPHRVTQDELHKLQNGPVGVVLTSEVFGLPSTLSIPAIDAQRRHADLLQKQQDVGLTDGEQQQLDNLNPQIQLQAVLERPKDATELVGHTPN